MPSPFFSIIVPTYNREKLLPRAVSSAMNQTFSDWELIIADDGSTDETSIIAASLCTEDKRIRAYKHSHRGLARTRNLGIKHARGRYITFLDSDDEYSPKHLQLRYDHLMANPEIQLLHGGVHINGDEFVADKYDTSKKISIKDCVTGGTFFLRRDLIESLGGFPHVEYGDDSAFFALAQQHGAIISKVDFPTYIYHRGESDSLCTIAEQGGMEAVREFQNIESPLITIK